MSVALKLSQLKRSDIKTLRHVQNKTVLIKIVL